MLLPVKRNVCSLMFAIPRLAIVCGLVVFPTGPLNVERETADFPELFRWDWLINGLSHSLHFALCRPFKNLLRKIRDLLLTLTPGELFVLERLLCQLEEPTDLEKKLQVAFLPSYSHLMKKGGRSSGSVLLWTSTDFPRLKRNWKETVQFSRPFLV